MQDVIIYNRIRGYNVGVYKYDYTGMHVSTLYPVQIGMWNKP